MAKILLPNQVEHDPYMAQTLRAKQTEPGLTHGTNFENKSSWTWSHTWYKL
jgi:hypothetical protein